jgi:hypothetical protein
MLFKDKELWNVMLRKNVKLVGNFVEQAKRDMKAKTILSWECMIFNFKM